MELGLFKGEVIKYDVNKGFGFIKILKKQVLNNFVDITEFYDDAFIHYKEIKTHLNEDGLAKLQIGDIVIFELHRNERGLKALDLYAEHNKYTDSSDTKYNKREYNDNQ